MHGTDLVGDEEEGVGDEVEAAEEIRGLAVDTGGGGGLGLFDEILIRDAVCWNAMISGYVQSGIFGEALGLFEEMRIANVLPNESTMVSVLSACARSGEIEVGKWVAGWIEGQGLGGNVRLVNALVDMCSKCGSLDEARSLFDGMQMRDVISWNVMIGGSTHEGRYKEALEMFRLTLRSNVESNDVTFLGILRACAQLGARDLGNGFTAADMSGSP
ncbi:hypothetical protein ACLB2K_000350 [Fragaria x ananassa]